jgi:hypothetical protein
MLFEHRDRCRADYFVSSSSFDWKTTEILQEMTKTIHTRRITTRSPVSADADAIIAIDKQGLATGHATFRDTPHDWNSFSADFLTGRSFAFIAEDERGIAAWAGCEANLRARCILASARSRFMRLPTGMDAASGVGC